MKASLDPATVTERLYDLATGDEEARLCRDIPEDQCREQPRNFTSQVSAQALSKVGDVLADSKVVLPWLLGTVGAPAFMVGLLVPIRESLALLPQILVGGFIRRFAVRKGFWVVSSAVEGACVVGMGAVGLAGWQGALAGWSIIALLVVFSLARGVASIAAKDTLGKTISKGRRGRVSGYAATLSGVVAAAVGLFLAVAPAESRPDWVLFALLIAAGVAWFLASAVFALVAEHPGATDGGRSLGDLVKEQYLLLIEDPELRKFLAARTLLVSTALVGPAYVSLAQRDTGQTLDNLGWLILATGVAGAISSAFWGALSDRSSRDTLVIAAAIAGVLGLGVLAVHTWLPGMTGHIGFYAGVLLLLGIAHAGVRIGRKTHIVDLAGGDSKAEYVALSNTVIGVVLLVVGAAVSVLLGVSIELGIVVMSVMALAGGVTAATLGNVQR